MAMMRAGVCHPYITPSELYRQQLLQIRVGYLKKKNHDATTLISEAYVNRGGVHNCRTK